MATESEQVRILRENELLQAEIARLKKAIYKAIEDLGKPVQHGSDYMIRMRLLSELAGKTGAVTYDQCPTGGGPNRRRKGCRCGDCKVCGWAKHTSIHGPYSGGGPDSAPVGHRYEAALSEEAGDGELKPEVEARLRESLKTPREDLLTPDEMRQKLETEP